MSGTSPPSPAAVRAIWGGMIAVMVLVGAVAYLSAGRQALTLPALGEVPAFSLTERSGRVVTRADLDGAPWVADFVFTRCTGM